MSVDNIEFSKQNKAPLEYELEFKLEASDSDLASKFHKLLDAAIKCGDVFIFDNGRFNLSCCFCNEKFNIFDDFMHHINVLHSENVKTNKANESELQESLLAEENDTSNSIFDDAALSLEDTPVISSEEKPNAAENLLKTDTKTNSIKQILQPVDYKHKCDFCERKFRTELGLTRHIKFHKQKDAPANLLKVEIKRPKKRYKAVRSVKCRYCDRLFYTPSQTVAHERIHTGEAPFQCTICSKCFRISRQLSQHMMTHNGVKPHKCSHCDIAFTSRCNLLVHIRRAHLGEKRYKCEFCDMRFVTNADKTKHVRSHTGEKPFQCELCGAKFKASSGLNEHKHRVHLKTRPHTCQVCGKKFLSGHCLKDHMAVHSDERPFSCETCGATFTRKKALVAHAKLHSDVKEYFCKICGKDFAQNAGLYSHMKSHRIDIEVKKEG